MAADGLARNLAEDPFLTYTNLQDVIGVINRIDGEENLKEKAGHLISSGKFAEADGILSRLSEVQLQKSANTKLARANLAIVSGRVADAVLILEQLEEESPSLELYMLITNLIADVKGASAALLVSERAIAFASSLGAEGVEHEALFRSRLGRHLYETGDLDSARQQMELAWSSAGSFERFNPAFVAQIANEIAGFLQQGGKGFFDETPKSILIYGLDLLANSKLTREKLFFSMNSNLAYEFRLGGELAKADEHYNIAINGFKAVAKEFGITTPVSASYSVWHANAADTKLQLGKLSEASRLASLAVSIGTRSIGSDTVKFARLNYIRGDVSFFLEDYNDTRKYYHKALSIVGKKELIDPIIRFRTLVRAVSLDALATGFVDSIQFETVGRLKPRTIRTGSHDEAIWHFMLGAVNFSRDKFHVSSQNFQDSGDILHAIGLPVEASRSLFWRSRALIEAGDVEQGCRVFQETKNNLRRNSELSRLFENLMEKDFAICQ